MGIVLSRGADVPPGVGRLDADVRVVRSAGELAELVGEAPILAVYDIRTPLVRELGGAAAGFEWIHAASAGVDAVLTPAVVDSDVVVTNARGFFDRPIAEYVVGVLIAVAKDLPRTLELQQRHTWRHRETRPVAGRRVVVVGAGSIGTAVARLASACGMRVTGIARSARDDADFEAVRPVSELREHLFDADDVVVTLPLTDDTRHLFDADVFAAMDGVTFVNVGRGPVVDEDALVAAIGDGRVATAALDVFETEPLGEDHPFWSMPEVIVSPHMSGDEIGWEERLTDQFAENLRRWRAGEPLANVVDKTGTADDTAGSAAAR